jgi:hypothetical protein
VRRDHPRPVVPAVVALLSTLALAACSTSTLRVTPPDPPPEEAEVCAELHAALPSTVDGEETRETAPESDLTAAWGDVVLRCGVDRPDALQATSELFTIQGVEWFVEPLTKGTRFTSVGLLTYVEIDVAESHEPEADAVVDLGDAVAENIPRV